MEPSRVCPLSDSLDMPNHGTFWGYDADEMDAEDYYGCECVDVYCCGCSLCAHLESPKIHLNDTGGRNSSFYNMMKECVIRKCTKGDWNLNQYLDTSNLTKEFDFNRNYIEKEIDDFYRIFLACENCSDPDPQFTKQLRKLTQSYRIVMEEVSAKLDQWLELRQRNIQNLEKALQKFSLLKRTTMGITRVSSIREFVVGFVRLVQWLFQFDMNLNYSVSMQVVSSLSVFFAHAALLYSNSTGENIILELWKEKDLLRDIEMVFRRANWIDKEIRELFPHGIDRKLVSEQASDTDGNLVEQWEPVLCSTVILTNIKKDQKLKCDMKFLASVKAFVRSTAAQIWIKRLRLRCLLNYMAEEVTELPYRNSMDGSEVFPNLAKINLLPLIFDAFYDAGKILQELKFLWNFLSAILTAHFLKYTGGFGGVEATNTKLQKDCEHVKKIILNLQADYD